jgi:2-polyprenyl-3-methyl-5-hydroxy-6-metoxy-1,4-benzoquinol methylase
MEKLSNKKLSDFLQSKNPSEAGFVDKIKIAYRPYICPFADLLNTIPEQASAFDIGCGSGMFLSLVSEFKNPRSIGGIEVSKNLIDNAKTILAHPNTPVFLDVFNGKDIPANISSYEYIFLIDVLHHVPKDNQIAFLKNIYEKMSPGSKLVFKDIDAGRKILSKFNKLHDILFSGQAGHEISFNHAKDSLNKLGFKILSTEKKRVFVYPHYTIVCQK